MAVLIKGIEMPKGCSWCPCGTVDTEWDAAWCQITKKSTLGVEGRRKDCPLVEVPERQKRDYKLLEESGFEC